MKDEEKFAKLISEARHWKMSGWDFSKLDGRWIEENRLGTFRKMILEQIPRSNSLLDLGTGGGEFLSSLAPLPKYTYSTEAYPPNAPVAKSRLSKLGVEVIRAGCDDNGDAPEQRGAIPHRAESLDFVIDRHESCFESQTH